MRGSAHVLYDWVPGPAEANGRLRLTNPTGHEDGITQPEGPVIALTSPILNALIANSRPLTHNKLALTQHTVPQQLQQRYEYSQDHATYKQPYLGNKTTGDTK
ncbi:hypothetical protein NDU88_009036 [Pleurodeles waltl]|uniref:Uncharacterized protein n=1 Tax=Pleurodeles waltl TaxID=8319 RepID=A0AAV7NBG3_PLEWA|nr:hypothetical protein NDU88_009036 [Pleurodeles waltl]